MIFYRGKGGIHLFTSIDMEHWDRREIYDKFCGYTFCLTAQIDITSFLSRVREKGVKFYPAACYCIAKTVNENQDYRYGQLNGQVGQWDHVDCHYTLLRKNTSLFTHMVTKYQEAFPEFYQAFSVDRELAENGHELYYQGNSPLDTVHISVLPGLSFTGLSLSKPGGFSGYAGKDISFIPFITIGKYFEQEGKIILPLAIEFHHAVNDGYHAQRFFALLEECFASFAAGL